MGSLVEAAIGLVQIAHAGEARKGGSPIGSCEVAHGGQGERRPKKDKPPTPTTASLAQRAETHRLTSPDQSCHRTRAARYPNSAARYLGLDVLDR